MLEHIIAIDHAVFYFINTTLANPLFDYFFPVYTNFHKIKIFMAILTPILLALAYYRARWKGVIVLLSAVALSTGVDQLVRFIKDIFNRPRPFNSELPFEVIFRGDTQGGLSFPSGHAADGFFIAVFLGLYFPRWRWYFIFLATLTAFSRIYCGVHYPTDVIAGALLGGFLAWLVYTLVNQIRQKKALKINSFIFLAVLVLAKPSHSFEDPTQGKPFFSWLWQDQFKPTITNSVDQDGLTILGVGALTTVAAHQYDQDVVTHNRKGHNLIMDRKTSKDFATLGGGALGIGIAVAQIVWDQPNGLMHARAITLTTVSHLSLAFITQRHRPDNREDYLPFPSSYPSGHASSAFASAGALQYAYGWKVGVPAYVIATGIAASRIAENAHWLSDVTSGIALGAFWAHASYLTEVNSRASLSWMPIPARDGLGVFIQHRF